MTRLARLFILAAVLVAAPAQANPFRDFLAASADAYGHYRGAVNYLRTGNGDLAAVELEAAGAGWRDILARYADAPPEAFATDSSWAATLAEVGRRLTDGLVEIDAGRPKEARAMVEPVRGLLAELRRRNNVRVFSDAVDELSAAMDRLWRVRGAPPDLAAPEVLRDLRAETAVLGYLFRRCRDEAPHGVRGNPDFERLIDGAAAGIGRLWRALETADPDLLINTLRELRSFENILYLRFG